MRKTLVILFLAGYLFTACSAPMDPAPTSAPLAESYPAPVTNLPLVSGAYPAPASGDVQDVPLQVFFTDVNRYSAGTEPFEEAVQRNRQPGANPPEAVLQEFFKGPTAEEKARGLEAITSGFTGFSKLLISDGVAYIYLTGECASNGATYTVAQPIMKNLLQFPEIQQVKIYDATGETSNPEGPDSSIPFCLEP